MCIVGTVYKLSTCGLLLCRKEEGKEKVHLQTKLKKHQDKRWLHKMLSRVARFWFSRGCVSRVLPLWNFDWQTALPTVPVINSIMAAVTLKRWRSPEDCEGEWLDRANLSMKQKNNTIIVQYLAFPSFFTTSFTMTHHSLKHLYYSWGCSVQCLAQCQGTSTDWDGYKLPFFQWWGYLLKQHSCPRPRVQRNLL